MSLVSDLYHNKLTCHNKARTFGASEKFYLTQEGVWDEAFHMTQSECLKIVDTLNERKSEECNSMALNAYDYCIDLIERRLLANVDN